ncbi:MAG: hypothetical protein HMLIMOIP_002078 [Candidatus Nitrosomirales archaeon]
MKYEIMTDYGDLIILSRHGRIILISRDMTEIVAKLTENYAEHMNKAQSTIERANDTHITTDSLAVEERPPYKQTNRDVVSNKKPDDKSLNTIFEL